MSVRASQWAWDIIAAGLTSSPGEALVLLRLADRADPEGVCWPGHSRTAADLNMTKRGVQKCIQRLQAGGLLEVKEQAAATGKTLTNRFQLNINFRGELSSPLQGRHEGEQCSPPRVNGVPWGGRTVVHPHVEPPVKNHHKEPPPTATAVAVPPSPAGGGGQKKIFDLAVQHGLSAAVARRFLVAAVGAGDDQIEALAHELPLRLAGARDKAAVAIKLAQLAARGELDDSTRDARQVAAVLARRRVEESTRQELEKRRADEAAVRRAQRGPSPGELACRALSQKFKRVIK